MCLIGSQECHFTCRRYCVCVRVCVCAHACTCVCASYIPQQTEQCSVVNMAALHMLFSHVPNSYFSQNALCEHIFPFSFPLF